MARTIRIKVYKFNELSEDAKQKAIEDYRSDGIDTSYNYDEAHETVIKFHQIFGTSRSWLDVNTSYLDDNLMNLKGLRLRTYIINNFYDQIFGKKWRHSWTTDKPVKHRKVKSIIISEKTGWTNKKLFGKYYNKYYDLTTQHECELTGVAWDEILLQPIYEFLEWNKKPYYNSYMDFDTLVNDCFSALSKSLEDEDNYQNSDEAIIEAIQANEYEFKQDGSQL